MGRKTEQLRALSEYGERIRYVRKENGGKPSAVNVALTFVQGELVWLFDDDDVALPDAIEKRVAALASCPGAGFVYSPHYLGTDAFQRAHSQRTTS